MATPKFDRDKAAKVLIDAVTYGDETACNNWGISRQTLYRYKQRLADDSELLQAVATYKNVQDKEWAGRIPEVLKSCLDFVSRAALRCEENDPQALHAIVGAIKVIAEVQGMRDILDARLTNQTGITPEEDRSLVPTTES